MLCVGLWGAPVPCPNPPMDPVFVVEETVAAASSSSALPLLLGFIAIVVLHKHFMKGEGEEWHIEEEE